MISAETIAEVAAEAPKTPYDVLTDVSPRLLRRGPDSQTVSQLGQSVSDVLHGVQLSGDESVLLRVVADLESARSSALANRVNREWALPLTALLGVLRQYLHDRMVDATSVNPASHTLRDRVIAALRAGVDTPTAIGNFVNSPPTVVSRVLRQLVDEERIERMVPGVGEDKRIRRYRLKSAVPSSLVTPVTEQPPREGLSNPAVLIGYVERQIETNPRLALDALPDLLRIGMAPDIAASTRVSALGAACVITRASEEPNAAQDALDLSETLDQIATRSGDKLLLSRAAYERARAGLFAVPDDIDQYLRELDSAEAHLEDLNSRDALMRRGWCEYTRSIIHDRISPDRAIAHMERAAQLFEQAELPYGVAASLTILARAYHAASYPAEATEAASRATALANSHGYLHIMAESSFWAGELLLEQDPTRGEVEQYFKLSGELFKAVGSRTWSALAEASEILARVEGGTAAIDENEAKALLVQFQDVWERFTAEHGDSDTSSRNWAAAVLARRLGALARRAGEHDRAAESYERAVQSYLARHDVLGATIARAGLAATHNNHREVQHQDVQEAIDDLRLAAGEEPTDAVAERAILSAEAGFGAEMRAAP